MKLGHEKYIDVIEHTQLVSIDLLVTNGDGSKILLGKRINEPARGTWFVPGSRLYKEETMEMGLTRVSTNELGISLSTAKLIGVFDHIYDCNFLERPGITTHYLALGMLVRLDNDRLMESIRPDDQHAEMEWFDISEETMARPDVHRYTKTYIALLQNSNQRSIPFGDARTFLK